MIEEETLYNVFVDTLQELIESSIAGDKDEVPRIRKRLDEMIRYASVELGLPITAISAMKNAELRTRETIKELIVLQKRLFFRV